MKRFVSILFVFIFIISAFSVTGVTAFAAEEGGMGEFIGSVQENTSVYMEKLTGLLESLKSYVPMEKIEALKSELTAWVKAIWGFISSNQTYKNIFTAIAAIIVFLLLPECNSINPNTYYYHTTPLILHDNNFHYNLQYL